MTKLPMAMLAAVVVFVSAQTAGAVPTNYVWNASSGNWSSPASWTPTGIPTNIDSASFGNNNESASSATVNNTVNTSFVISKLNYTNFTASGSYAYPVTAIASGTTLTVTNNLLVGGQTGSGSSASFGYVVGAGTLNVTAPSLLVADGGTGSGPCAYLNLGGLTNFIYNNPNGSFGVSSNGQGLATRIGGAMTFACINNITANVLNLGTEGSAAAQGGPGLLTTSFANFGTEPNGVQNNAGPIASGIPAILTLGSVTNNINASTINIASFKNGFIVTNAGGGLRIRGVTGANSDANVNITIGNRNSGGGSGQTTGWLLLDGCPVDIKANQFVLGYHPAEGSGNPSGAEGGNGLLQFDTGTISANSFLMADNFCQNNGGNTAVATGEIQVGANGTLLIGAGQLFALASCATTPGTGNTNIAGPAVGIMIVSNGLINCQGPIVMGASTNASPPTSTGLATGIIQLIGAGTLNMGPNSYVGSIGNPITGLLLDTNSVFSISIPAPGYTNVCVNSLAWPSPDNNLTLSVAAVPATITNGQTFPFLHFNTLTNSIIVSVPGFVSFTNNNATSGAFNNPKVSLPLGIGGYMYQSNNNVIYLDITSGAGLGGVNVLTNAYFITNSLYWTASGSGATVVNSGNTYPGTSGCANANDGRNVVPLPNTGTNVAKLTGTGVTTGSTNIWSQRLPVFANSQIVPGATALSPGAQVNLGGNVYVAHEDMISGADSFYFEVDFLDANNNLIAAYESGVLTNYSCGNPNLDQWDVITVTNQMQVTGGMNTGTVIGTVPGATVSVPAQSAAAVFKAVLVQRSAGDLGSVYFSGANIGFISSPVGPSLSAINPNLVTLCTNGFLTCVATSSITAISGVQVTAVTTTLAGSVTNTTVYTNNLSAGLTVTGLGTSAANIYLALAPNTIYQSVTVAITDADGLSFTAAPVNFDTLSPNLVIEASDFNYNGGSFIDTPPNGGLALYQGLVGTANIDEFKNARTNTQSYYRTNDATIIQAANPAAPSGTEQKFVTAAANGNTNFEVAIAYDSPGDWQDYTRTVASSGGSIQPGTYNVYCYLANSAAGNQVKFYQVTNGTPNSPNQLTNFLGYFGGSSFSDNGYNNFVYAPLVDAFGNRVELALTNPGATTFKAQIASGVTPNVGFYMFVPYVPILNPVFLNVYPTNGTFEPANSFGIAIGQANGGTISTNGIGMTINGVPVTSGLTFTALPGGGWMVNYPILTNNLYTIVVNVTNQNGYTASYSDTFDTFDVVHSYHWMAVDYDFSTNNGTSSGGSIGDGWTGGLFIDNPIATGDNQAPTNSAFWELQTNSYYGYPMGFGPTFGPLGGDTLAHLGAVAHQGVDINWVTNATQDPGGSISNSIYRLGIPYAGGGAAELNNGDGVGNQIAADSFLLPEFTYAVTNNASGNPDTNICEFNIAYFYANDWLNYTHTYPSGTFNIWGRLAAGGGAFSGCTLSMVTNGWGTSNELTTVLGTFSDPSPSGWQTYHWVELLDTNSNPVYVTLNGQATLRLTAPTNSTSAGNGLNPLFFLLSPATPPTALMSFQISVAKVAGNLQISIPTQSGHSYTVWYSASLSPASWSQVGGSITGDGTTHTVSETLSGSTGFFEVKAQ